MRPREEDVIFVVDECCGPHVAKGLRDGGCKAVELVTLVPAGTEDVNWIPKANSWGHAIITRDVRMRSNEHERAALELSGVHIFMLRGGLSLDDLYSVTKAYAPAMLRHVIKYSTPYLAYVTRKAVDVKVGMRRGAVKRN